MAWTSRPLKSQSELSLCRRYAQHAGGVGIFIGSWRGRRHSPLHLWNHRKFFILSVVHRAEIVDEHLWIHPGGRRLQSNGLGNVRNERDTAVKNRMPDGGAGLELLDVGDDAVVLGLADDDPVSCGHV